MEFQCYHTNTHEIMCTLELIHYDICIEVTIGTLKPLHLYTYFIPVLLYSNYVVWHPIRLIGIILGTNISHVYIDLRLEKSGFYVNPE